MRKFGLLGTSAICSAVMIGSAFFASAPAYAQSQPPAQAGEPDDDKEKQTEGEQPENLGQNEVELESGQSADEGATGEEILITGSRIRRPNLQSTVPITSVGPSEVVEQGEVSLGDALSQLPSLRSTFTQANSTAAIGTAGINGLDLRGLGTQRTLVLVNGRRHVTVQPGSATVDVNTIPVDLLERVDIVTGGNSAIYGSDAVTGVVNFVLKRDYEGFKVRGQGGVSTYGDAGSYFVSAIAGRNIFDDRLNVAVAVEHAHQEPLFFAQRPYLGAFTGTPAFITAEITNAPNRNFNGIPNTRFVDAFPGSTFNTYSLGGGVITSCPAEPSATNPNRAAILRQRQLVCTGELTPTGGRLAYNFMFLPNGALVRNDPSQGLIDFRSIGGGVLGGLGASGVEDAMLQPGHDRYSANLLISAELSRAFRPFLEAKYVHVDATQATGTASFTVGTLSGTFNVDNGFLSPQTQQQLRDILGPGATAFTLARLNSDFGPRTEDHDRDTYRIVTGVSGDLSERGSLRYELAFNFGRTETYYETGGNVHIQRYHNAIDAVVAPASFTGRVAISPTGQRVACRINVDASTTNDDPNCVPINLFGYGAPQPEALAYISHTSSREQWAEQINAVGFISGDSTGIFELPGGPIGFALGAEYRKEDAYSIYDPVTRTFPQQTFLNAFAPFDPPAVDVREAFGEIRIPLLADMPFFEELSFEGAARVSDYGGKIGAVWAYNAGVIWSPVRDLRLRGSYARSVRAPTQTNLFAARTTTFNAISDPCDQPGGANSGNNITTNPNRAANCAAAGIPTTITYTDQSGNTVTRPWTNVTNQTIAGFNQGNPELTPEVGKSFTLGAVFQPRFLPGFSLSVDYYDIKIEQVISGLTGQAIVNRCYDDPGGINNPFCAAVFRRRTPGNPVADFTFEGQVSRVLENRPVDPLDRVGSTVGFINQPFNFAALKTSGIDLDAAYRRRIGANTVLNLRAIISWVDNRENFSYLTDPTRSDRLHGTLGDPVWAGSFTTGLDFGMFDIRHNARYVGKQIVSGFGYETFFGRQGRQPTNPDARPFVYYDPVIYHNLRLGFEASEQYKFYMGVDNVTNELPPFELTGTGSDAIYPNTGRFFYAGAEFKF